MTDQTVQQVDPIKQREAIKQEQASLDTNQNHLSQEIEKLQNSFQTMSDSFDALLSKRDNIEDEVEDLYMKLYRCVHGIVADNSDSVSQKEYQVNNGAYDQLCYQKSELERQLVQIDEEIERLDIAKSNLSESMERLLDENLALILRRDSLEKEKRTLMLVMLNSED